VRNVTSERDARCAATGGDKAKVAGFPSPGLLVKGGPGDLGLHSWEL
jgi:hypothetical protein